jgi:hypothetical protein
MVWTIKLECLSLDKLLILVDIIHIYKNAPAYDEQKFCNLGPRIRLDFETFGINGPADTVETNGGACNTDSFKITVSGVRGAEKRGAEKRGAEKRGAEKWGAGSGERGAGSGERGAGSRERGAGSEVCVGRYKGSTMVIFSKFGKI